jgi:GlpG protein
MTQNKLLLAFGQERIARLLVNYLQSQGIQAEYCCQSGEYPHAVKLLDILQLELAEQIAREFVANPQDKKYQQAAWQSGRSVELNTSPSFSGQIFWQNLWQSPLTSLVIAICIAVYGLQYFGISQVYTWLNIQPLSALLENAQWWRIIGPAFIHYSMLHIVFNLLWWWMLGKQIEQKFGISSLLLLLVFSAVLSNIGQFLISGPNFGGLSGVVYALVGCVWWLGWLRPDWGISLPKPMIGFLLAWLLIGYADVLWISMANTAHTVGLITGCVFAWLLVNGDKYQKKSISPDIDI